ncbi:hypothetical protein RSSM_02135 [Rhodopirellula sallentina SM41]|uniref:Uncharacterized protein n=1 Tax=Rhodopirellula sallentina SM41 TaxID=1263870 RepID=M5U590_9BACT|nr:hypothetical protein RSSM_02135 [Rhodopirellula sallentina SM41]
MPEREHANGRVKAENWRDHFEAGRAILPKLKSPEFRPPKSGEIAYLCFKNALAMN